MIEQRKRLIEKLLEILLELGYISRQGYADWKICLENHKIVRIEFNDKEKFI